MSGSALTVTLLDGRTYRGTPLEIVDQMLTRAIFCETRTVAGYAAFVVENTRKGSGIVLNPTGADDESLAGSLVSEMLRVGLATRPS
jgi:hypothetical protein